jgi:hypothetical protein
MIFNYTSRDRTAVVQRFHNPQVVGSNPTPAPNQFFIIMSLLSQKDREIAIAALENYVMKLRKESGFDDARVSETNALLNWIKIEYQKHI